ncbi:MAG: SGNH/GDSL hydrolase family protein, partial [Planctomycetales bacterium]|nr:SGNH/GDSL hydrolase family protein [Planctomycetales bacterium]
MTMISLLRVPATLVALFVLFSAATVSAQTPVVQPGDHVAYIGNTLADRMQHDGWLESYIHALHPDYDLTFRNLGYSADEVKTRPRADNFGSPDQWLEKVSADVIFCFFGYNEALRGEAGLEQFREEFAEMLDGMLSHKYNGESAPRIVVFSPIANEDLDDPNLPDPAEKNRDLKLYSDAMAEISAEKGVRFVDIYGPSVELYESADEPLTMNSVHLLPHGNKALAQAIVRRLFGASAGSVSEERLEAIRQAVVDKNYEWFSRYRVIDEYNVFGGRSKLEWFGQSNADVMMREMEIFDVKTANRDKRVWAVAKGGDLEVVDDNLPSLVPVRTNKPGPLADESFPYLGGEEAISR